MSNTTKKPLEEEVLEEEVLEEEVLDEEVPEEELPADAEEEETAPEAEAETAPEEEASDLDVLQKALEEEQNRYLRLMAEYDNFRKRTAREKTGIYADAKADAFTGLLPVLDNFDRAFDNADASPEDFMKGIEMTRNQLLAAFEKAGVEAFGEPGEPFDPNLHNAVSHIEDPEQGENVLAQVYQKGYKLGDKVLRHAMVVVAN